MNEAIKMSTNEQCSARSLSRDALEGKDASVSLCHCGDASLTSTQSRVSI